MKLEGIKSGERPLRVLEDENKRKYIRLYNKKTKKYRKVYIDHQSTQRMTKNSLAVILSNSMRTRRKVPRTTRMRTARSRDGLAKYKKDLQDEKDKALKEIRDQVADFKKIIENDSKTKKETDEEKKQREENLMKQLVKYQAIKDSEEKIKEELKQTESPQLRIFQKEKDGEQEFNYAPMPEMESAYVHPFGTFGFDVFKGLEKLKELHPNLNDEELLKIHMRLQFLTDMKNTELQSDLRRYLMKNYNVPARKKTMSMLEEAADVDPGKFYDELLDPPTDLYVGNFLYREAKQKKAGDKIKEEPLVIDIKNLPEKADIGNFPAVKEEVKKEEVKKEEAPQRIDLGDIFEDEEMKADPNLSQIDFGEFFGMGRKFADIKKDYVAGNGISDQEINEIMEKYNIPGWQGAITIDEITGLKPVFPMCFIVNLITSREFKLEPDIVGHWCAVVIKDWTVEWFDPFGDQPPKIFEANMRILFDKVDDPVMYRLKVNDVRWQNVRSDNCGWFAMQFILRRMVFGWSFKEATGYHRKIIDMSKLGEEQIETFKEYNKFF